MEGNFTRKQLDYLSAALQQVQNSEQTLEIKLPEGMPDVGQVLSAWGQPVMRSKEWQDSGVQFNGGMMIWVLYAPEDGSGEQCIHGWIPFQMRWELPENTPEGFVHFRCLPRFVDGRSTSPRKILVRAGLAVLAEGYAPETLNTAVPGQMPEDVALLENTYPMRLIQEAGEKAFLLEDTLHLPESAPEMEQLICWRLNPRVLEQRVLADKAVMRGNGNLHVLYRSSNGQLHSWDFEIPFSQYAELRKEYGSEARMELALMPTVLELELGENGELALKGGMAAQYIITDKQPISLVEDAYSPSRELGIQVEDLTPPVILENRRENIYGEQTLPVQADVIADVQFLPDFPRQRPAENGVALEYPGQCQILYYGEDGGLHASGARWTGGQNLAAAENVRISAVPLGGDAQAVAGNGRVQVKLEMPIEMVATTEQTLPMVTGVELGQQKKPDPNRPSLILQRAGESRLWDIAKAAGSTVGAIRRANNLEDEPAPNQMLLIPIP